MKNHEVYIISTKPVNKDANNPDERNMNAPMREASSKWVLHRTWSMGDMVPSLAPLFWILTMLMRLERRITDMVPAIVFTVAGPFPIFNWSRLFITRSLKGPIFTNKRNARTPSAKITKNNSWIILCSLN